MYCSKCNREMEESRGSHQYRECGLDNVFLNNIPVYKCTTCGRIVPIITHIDDLHRLIADNLTTRKEVLSGKELRFIRKMMGIKAIELAEILGVSKQRISQWENDKGSIGVANDRLIKSLYRFPNLLKSLRLLTPMERQEFNLDFPTFLASIKMRELKEGEVCH